MHGNSIQVDYWRVLDKPVKIARYPVRGLGVAQRYRETPKEFSVTTDNLSPPSRPPKGEADFFQVSVQGAESD